MRTLNIVGCGRAGRTFTRLFRQAHAFLVQDLHDVNQAAARACAQFADGGRPVRDLAAMRPAQVWLIATPDDAIVDTAARLVTEACIAPGNVVVHLSGATPSLDMEAVIEHGAHAGSFHPLKTFADPGYAAGSFAGTYVALEGDKKALKILRVALRKIGARVFEIEPHAKVHYHAGSVMVCNYLTAVLEAGLRCYEHAGIKLETAYKLMEPLVRETVDNVFRVGTVRALTGPIARGDDALVARQLRAVRAHDRNLGALYRELGRVALDLARSQGGAEARNLARIARLLRE
ncbi:MAG: DUF2520 domain-containing protein [Burkholderiales bacterium]|nr:DUF2520 domain-containing protein [Burkholderiales bacterium]